MNVLNVVSKAAAARDSWETVKVVPLEGGVPCFRYYRNRLYNLRGQVASMLSQVDDSMKQSSGIAAKARWIMARYDWQGNPWTCDLRDVDALLAMGRALGMVKVFAPCDGFAQCEMPLLQIMDMDAKNKERLLPKGQRNWGLASWWYKRYRIK